MTETPKWGDLFGIAPDFPDESDERAIRKQVAEEIAQALLKMADEIGDGEQRELFTDLAELAREIGSKEATQ